MSEPFVVEIWGELAGIVLKDGNAFRFQAVDHRPCLLAGSAVGDADRELLVVLGLPLLDEGVVERAIELARRIVGDVGEDKRRLRACDAQIRQHAQSRAGGE